MATVTETIQNSSGEIVVTTVPIQSGYDGISNTLGALSKEREKSGVVFSETDEKEATLEINTQG
jgi:hypothetical protein